MSYNVTTTPAVGDATKRSDYVRLRDSIQAIAFLTIPLGGRFDQWSATAAMADLPHGYEVEIDGTNLSGLSVYLEVNAMGHDTATYTITIELYSITDAAAVAGSTITLAGAKTAYQIIHSKSAAITLGTSLKNYKVRIQTSSASNEVTAVAWLSIRG